MFIEDRLKRLAVFTAAVFLLLVGLLLNVSQMLLMAVALTLIQPVFWVAGLLMLRGLSCRRIAPQTCGEGERVRVELLIRNNSRTPKFYLRAGDRLPRWIRYAGNDAGEAPLLLNLWPGETGRLAYLIEPQKRGLHQIGPTRILAPDLIGMSKFVRILNEPDEILVYPQIIPVRPEFLSGGAERGWRDQENAPGRGEGTDFHGVRDYRMGDDLRRINWKTTARTGALAVTEYSLGYANDVAIVLDLAESSYQESGEGNESALEYAIKIAASIAAAALRQGSAVQMMTNSLLPGLDPLLRGSDQLPRLLDALARAEANGRKSLTDAVSEGLASGLGGALLLCVTPLPADDPDVAGALSLWQRSGGGEKPFLLLLDRAAFGAFEATRFSPDRAEENRSARITDTPFRREFLVGPGCNLAEMFERVGGRAS